MNNSGINKELILKIDSENMFKILKDFPEQVRQACEIGISAPGFNRELSSNDFLIAGMGGSAIGGSLVGSYLASFPELNIRITVNRNYDLPGFVDKNTNVIASSYSGGTEETISVFEKARERTENIACITSGGRLGELADKYGFPVISIPGGYQPRCALGYSFFPMLYLVMKSGALTKESVNVIEDSISETVSVLETLSELYSNPENTENTALELAQKLHETIPVIYSADSRLDAVNLRWRGQIQENAKNPAFGGFLPEMNHNEINGWSLTNNGLTRDILNKFSIILLQDPEDHPQVSKRFNALKNMLNTSTSEIISLAGNGNSLLARVFSLIYLADWVSFYLAILNGTDPTPIPMITKLKKEMSKG